VPVVGIKRNRDEGHPTVIEIFARRRMHIIQLDIHVVAASLGNRRQRPTVSIKARTLMER